MLKSVPLTHPYVDKPCSKASVYGFHAAFVAATKKPIVKGVFANLRFFDLVLDGLDFADLSLDFDDLDFDDFDLGGLDLAELELDFDDLGDAMLPSIAVSIAPLGQARRAEKRL
jgi:hypothetical protein